jgi:lipopolysaccharide transport system permease protein
MFKDIQKNIPITTLQSILVICAGWFVSIWGRFTLPFGKELQPEYIFSPFEIVFACIFCPILLNIIIYQLPRGRLQIVKYPFLLTNICMIMVVGIVVFFFPDISLLQSVYFLCTTIILSSLLILLPNRMKNRLHPQYNIVSDSQELYSKRALLFVWLWFRIEERYSQTILGILWIALLPLSTSIVLAFAIDLVGGGRVATGASSISFLLTGIAFFTLFSDLILKAKGNIINVSGIIRQVYFPREILVILLIGEVLIDFAVIFIATILINLTQGVYPNSAYLLLPIPILLLVCMGSGFAFILSWLGLIVQDLQQLVTIVMQLLFYIIVLISPGQLPDQFDYLMQIIPITGIVEAFRVIILFGEFPNVFTLFYPAVFSLAVFYFGYVTFKIHENWMFDYL